MASELSNIVSELENAVSSEVSSLESMLTSEESTITTPTFTSDVTNSCCPKACPTVMTGQGCCQPCPSSCLEAPDRLEPLVMTPLEQCKTTKLSWGAMKSCGPILKTDIQCADSKGAFWPVTPSVTGPKLFIDVPNSFFAETPFNLVNGDKLLCKIRAHNSNGSGSWSMTNEPFSMNGCSTPAVPTPSSGCGNCNKACKTTGCASCCSKKKSPLLENHVHE